MLGHQLQALPPFEQFWNELPNIFNWFNGVSTPSKLSLISADKEEDFKWTPPQTIWQLGLGVPLESIRFAAVNHLCVELGYGRSVRLIEPYSLRRTKDDNLILHAVKVQTGESRSYRVDNIESVKVTTKTFQPKYEIEFSPMGIIQTKPMARKVELSSFGSYRPGEHFGATSRKRASNPYGMKYVFQCGICQKKFIKSTNDTTLRSHKNLYGMPCSGRRGYFIGNK